MNTSLPSNDVGIPEIYAWVRAQFGGRFPSMDEIARAFYERCATPETKARPRDWVNCPICGEPEMLKEFDKDGRGLIHCTNRVCPSNNSEAAGGRDEMLREIRAAHHLNPPNTTPCQCRWCSPEKTTSPLNPESPPVVAEPSPPGDSTAAGGDPCAKDSQPERWP
jgi:hypothetical protein